MKRVSVFAGGAIVMALALGGCAHANEIFRNAAPKVGAVVKSIVWKNKAMEAEAVRLAERGDAEQRMRDFVGPAIAALPTEEAKAALKAACNFPPLSTISLDDEVGALIEKIRYAKQSDNVEARLMAGTLCQVYG